MKKSDTNHNEPLFLAKWLSNELSDAELKEYVSEDDFKAFKKIKNGLNYFEAPDFDAEKIRLKIKATLPNKKLKKVNFQRNLFIASAATIAILFSVYFYSNTLKLNFETNFGEQKMVVLNDGSEVILNVKSVLSYKKNNWNSNRIVNLNGEAFFKVTKGSTFQVQTKNGTVTVLGTKFNINSQTNFFSIMCYEGKVMVVHEKDTIYLTKGKAYQNNNKVIDKWEFSESTPTWQTGETSFKSTPLKIVISSLEKQFGIEIKYTNIDDKKLFTGIFSNTDMETALKSVFIPMQINYHIENKKVFLSKK